MDFQSPKFWKFVTVSIGFLCIVLISALICVLAYSNNRSHIEYLEASHSDATTSFSQDQQNDSSSKSTASRSTTTTKTSTTTKTTTNTTKTTERITEKYTKETEKTNSADSNTDLLFNWFLKMYEDYWDQSQPVPSSSTPDLSSKPEESIPSSSEESSVPDSSSQPDDSSTPGDQQVDFSFAESEAQRLSDEYGVSIQFTTQQPNDQPIVPGAFTDCESIQNLLWELEGCFKRVSAYTLQGIFYEDACRILFLSQPETHVSYEEIEGEKWFVVSGQGNEWVSQFSQYLAEKALENMELNGVDYSGFTDYNPEGFVYGEYKPEYIGKEPENIYFATIQSFESEEADRKELLIYYWSCQFKESNLVSECPLYHKLSFLLETMEIYL